MWTPNLVYGEEEILIFELRNCLIMDTHNLKFVKVIEVCRLKDKPMSASLKEEYKFILTKSGLRVWDCTRSFCFKHMSAVKRCPLFTKMIRSLARKAWFNSRLVAFQTHETQTTSTKKPLISIQIIPRLYIKTFLEMIRNDISLIRGKNWSSGDNWKYWPILTEGRREYSIEILILHNMFVNEWFFEDIIKNDQTRYVVLFCL